VFVYALQVTFNRPEKLGSYSCTAANNLGKITRRFNLIEGFKPKTPSGLSVARVGDNYIELQVVPNDVGDELIGYRVEYVTKVVEPSGNTFESFDMMNFNTTEGTCNRLRLPSSSHPLTSPRSPAITSYDMTAAAVYPPRAERKLLYSNYL